MPDELLDFTHRPMGLNHEPDPTPRGVPIEFHGMDPQKAGRLLVKVARKSMGKGKGPAGKGKARVGKPTGAKMTGKK